MGGVEKVPLKVSFQNIECTVELAKVLSPRTIESLVGAVPFTSKAFLWKEEIYFETPISVGPERPKASVKTGDVAYWPPGKAFCIFFGSTQPYSPVNVIGKVTSSLDDLRRVRQGEWVKVERW